MVYFSFSIFLLIIWGKKIERGYLMWESERTFTSYLENNKQFFRNPIIKSFLEQNQNKALVKKAIEEKDAASSKILDYNFEEFYMKVRLIDYTDKLSRLYVKTYDQQKRKKHHELTLDKPFTDENNLSVKDSIPSPHLAMEDLTSYNIEDFLPSEHLKKIYQSFSYKKKRILHLFVFNDLTNIEIASRLDCSPQNVSKLKKKSLTELREGWEFE